ncbi:MAG: hypothetical protein ACQKBY_06830 [Verrucomicrobiales bacterium]
MSSVYVEVTPANEQLFRYPQSGEVELLVPDGSTVEKDQVWAVSKPERLALEERSIALEAEMLEHKVTNAKLEAADQLDSLRENLAELELKQSKLAAVRQQPEFADNPRVREKTNEALAALARQLERLKQRVTQQEKGLALQNEIKKLRLDFEKRQNEFSFLKESSEYRATFAGVLRYQLEHAEIPESFPARLWLESGATLASITDKRHQQVSLDTLPPTLNNTPPENLILKINTSPPGQRIQADFHSIEHLSVGDRSAERAVFRIRPDDQELAAALPPGPSLAVIYAKLDEPAHIVPKAYVLKFGGARNDGGDWSRMVRAIWPEARLVATGYHTLAIRAAAASEKPGSETPAEAPAP